MSNVIDFGSRKADKAAGSTVAFLCDLCDCIDGYDLSYEERMTALELVITDLVREHTATPSSDNSSVVQFERKANV